MNSEILITKATELIFTYGPKLLGAIFVLVVGLWFLKLFVKGFEKGLKKGNVDSSLRPFITGIVRTLLKVLLTLSVLGMLGIEMTSFIAILGAVGLAVGMALSGMLQNFAGGVMILLFKPFKVGDTISAQSFTGTVSEIQIFNTILKTPDNKTIIIPNGGLSGSSMTNFSTESKRRVEWVIGVAYGDDIDKAREVIRNLCNEDERILTEPPVAIVVSQLAESSVNITVRAWVNSKDFWNVFFEMNENVYKTFGKEGLNLPFPQMDVHLHKQ